MLLRSRPRRIALLAGLTIVLVAGPAFAVDSGNGSKNFHAPASVPNYFSNEAGPMLGGAAETRRSELYPSQMAQVPQAAAIAAVAAPARQHVAMAVLRGKVVRGRHGERNSLHHVAAHGRSTAHTAARGSRSHATAAKAAVKTRVGSNHGRARG